MALFNITLHHKGYFGYVDGLMRYVGGEKLVIEENDSDFWCVFEAEEQISRLGTHKSDISAMWYKNPAIGDYSVGLRMFLNDRDALDMCRIAAERGGIWSCLWCMRMVLPKGSPRLDAAPIDEGDVGDGDAALEEQGHENEGDIAGGPEIEDSDSDDAEYIPSADDVDSADDVHFTDSEEEFEFDDNFFGLQTEAGEKSGDEKGKRVVNEEFSDAGEDSDELQDGHTVGGYEREEGGDEGSEGDTIVFSIHKPQQNMAEYRWQVGTVYASREEFNGTVTANAVYTKRGIKFDKVDPKRVIVNCQENCPFRLYCVKMSEEDTWQLRSVKDRHNCAQVQRDDIMPPPHRNPSHRPIKKRRRGPAEEEGQNQSHLPRTGQIQRCSNCGVASHKKRGCKKPPTTICAFIYAPPTKKAKGPSSSNGKGKATTKFARKGKDKALSQPPPETSNKKKKAAVVASSSQPLPTRAKSNPIPKRAWCGRARIPTPAAPKLQNAVTQPNTQSTARPNAISASESIKTSQKPTAKPTIKPSSSQPIGNRPRFCVRHVGGSHVSPQKLRQMAKLPPRAWGNI
ncbi:hypothetical protein PIB30_050091 [Stylosanthes scabra]|uniref:Transposase MuDR plant domain-containing protein n=1 Tax=Stylosanthes scabra TaxID=79078 RepID=A0ABU6XHU2_9FABA|nr:hypothetical protein [Stylosanthes scabra]